ncbi:MAG: phosphate signaling complex protein PhoU [Lachnospiraceae bacterium]
MPRILLEKELKILEQSVMEMSGHVENTFVKLKRAIEQKDKRLMTHIIESDHIINDMQRAIESRCLIVITKQTPIAGDLRVVSACLKVVTDIERMGDHAGDIAELIVRMDFEELSNYSIHFPNMMDKVIAMIHDATTAFVTRDVGFAKMVIASDDIVDEYFNQIKEDLIEKIKENKVNPDGIIDALMISKYLERVGDHAVNICEWETFQETGVIEQYRLL